MFSLVHVVTLDVSISDWGGKNLTIYNFLTVRDLNGF